MNLTQILQKLRSYLYTKKEIDSMGGGTSLSSTLNSKANKSDLNNYLPLTGGWLSGNINFRNGCYTYVGYDTELSSERYVVTTTSSKDSANIGGALYLYGGDHENPWGEKGNFRLVAQSKEKGSKYLLGTPSGSLTWNGKELATQEYINTNLGSKANDSDVVHKTGNETISGIKTFSNTQTYFGRDVCCYSNAKYGKNLNPTTTSYQYVFFNGNKFSDGTTDNWYGGYLEQIVNTDGSSRGRWLIRDTSENPVGIELWASGDDKQIRPYQNNNTDLGNAGRKFKDVYATTFHGDVDFPITEAEVNEILGID